MCPPADSSLGGYGILPYPRRLLWDLLPRNTPNSQNLLLRCPPTDFTLSLQKKAIRLNNQGKTMIAKDSFVPLL